MKKITILILFNFLLASTVYADVVPIDPGNGTKRQVFQRVEDNDNSLQADVNTKVETIEAGTNVTVDRVGNTVTINATAGADVDAIHDNVAGEINAITEKATPVSADIIVIEDSADSYNKKKVQIGNLPGGSGAVDSVNGYTGVVVLDKADIGLANADNTSDADKPISTATQTALDLKADLNGTSAITTTDDVTQKASIVSEVATQTTPSVGFGKIYAKSDNQLYFLNDVGTEIQITGAGGSTAWGAITGTLSNQTDLQNALDAKADSNGTSDIITTGVVQANRTRVTEITTPTTPATGFGDIYAKTDGQLYFLNDAGTEIQITGVVVGNVSTSGTPVVNDYARFVNGTDIEGRSYTEVKTDLSLQNVDNTSDADKPISTATQTALDAKVTGPASSVDNNIVTFDGTTGKLIKDSGATISGTGEISTPPNSTPRFQFRDSDSPGVDKESSFITGEYIDGADTAENTGLNLGVKVAGADTNAIEINGSDGDIQMNLPVKGGESTSVEVTTTGATLNLDYTATKMHTVTFDQNCDVSITNWPTSGLVGSVGVRCINANGFTVTIEGKSLIFATNRELVVLISTDGGTTVDATVSSLE